MMKRISWFISGAVAGIAGAGYTKRKLKATASHLAPTNVARAAVAKVRASSHDVVAAVRDGRDAMYAKETELWALVHGRADSPAIETGPDDQVLVVGPDDQVLVDGHPVEPGQVIVLREVRDNDHAGPRRNSRRTRRGT